MGRVLKCAAVLFLSLGLAAICSAQARDRVLRSVDSGERSVVHGNMSVFATADRDQGRVNANMLLSRVTLSFRPSAEQQRALDQLLAEQQDPQSPNFHKWLTPEQYGERFGMSQNDMNAVKIWLETQGLTVMGVSRGRTEMYFSGTVGQLEAALHTELHHYLVNGEMHFANASDPSVPAALANVVRGVRGLNNFSPKPRARPSPRFNASATNHLLSPNDFATIYKVKSLYDAGFDGSGQKIAVIGQTAISTTDIDAFRSAAGLSPRTNSNFQQVLVPQSGTSTHCAGDEFEADLDIEWSGAVAKNATVIYVTVGLLQGDTCDRRQGSNVFDAAVHAINNNVAPVISNSYGVCEVTGTNGNTADEMAFRTLVQQANSQGQTFITASGDEGAADCEVRGSSSATLGLAVDIPAAIPEVTAIGGTEFNEGATTFWDTTEDAGGGSALGYIPEIAWNDTGTLGHLSSSGGGASAVFAKPSWQNGITPADARRDVPDISLNASPAHDPYLVCSQTSYSAANPPVTGCATGFVATDQTVLGVGGTSAGAPAFAGILALINQGTGSSGQGNVNPALYTLATTAPTAFHDITAGNNIVPCVQASLNCPSSAPFQFGFSAGSGYDQATGLGSVDAFVLANSWVFPKIASTTVVTAPGPIVPKGGPTSFTATVTPTPTPAPAGSSPSGGSVQFTVDGINSGPAVLVSNNTATFTTSSLTAGGAHTVGAVYNGNLAYSGSTASAISVTVADYAVSAPAVAAPVTRGSTGTSTATVSTTDGFTGTVALSCTPSSSTAQITCMMSPATVTLSTGTASATSTLTVTTVAPHAIGGTINASARPKRGLGWLQAGGAGVFAAIVLFGVPSRRRGAALLGMVLLVGIAGTMGCGGGGGGGQTNPGTPTGNYTITVTAASGGATRTTTVAFSVQ